MKACVFNEFKFQVSICKYGAIIELTLTFFMIVFLLTDFFLTNTC
jgi:hypothetical protein